MTILFMPTLELFSTSATSTLPIGNAPWHKLIPGACTGTAWETTLPQARGMPRILGTTQQSSYNICATDLDFFKNLDRHTRNQTVQNYFFRVKRCILSSVHRGLKNYRLSLREMYSKKYLFT